MRLEWKWNLEPECLETLTCSLLSAKLLSAQCSVLKSKLLFLHLAEHLNLNLHLNPPHNSQPSSSSSNFSSPITSIRCLLPSNDLVNAPLDLFHLCFYPKGNLLTYILTHFTLHCFASTPHPPLRIAIAAFLLSSSRFLGLQIRNILASDFSSSFTSSHYTTLNLLQPDRWPIIYLQSHVLNAMSDFRVAPGEASFFPCHGW